MTKMNNDQKKEYSRRKVAYIKKVEEIYHYSPRSIGFWKLSLIKERFPVEDGKILRHKIK